MKLLKNLIMVLMCAMVVFTSATPCYSGSDGLVVDSGGSGLSDVGTKLVDTADEGKELMVSVCMALFPLSLIATGVLLLFTKNERKFASLLWFAGAVCAVTLFVLLVNNGTVLNLIEKCAEALRI